MISPAVGGLREQSFGWQATFWQCFLGSAGLVLADYMVRSCETMFAIGPHLGPTICEYPELPALRVLGYSMAASLLLRARFLLIWAVAPCRAAWGLGIGNRQSWSLFRCARRAATSLAISSRARKANVVGC